MPSASSLALAQQLKTSVVSPELPGDAIHHVPHSRWFRPPSQGGPRIVSRKDIAAFSDDEYRAWRTVHPSIHHVCDASSKLDVWLRAVDVNELADLLDTTPSGCVADASNDAFLLTKWQRLSLAVYTCLPFDVSSQVTIDVNTLRTLAQYTESEIPRARAQPIQAHYSMLKGSFPACGIIDLPTAGGKTAWALSMAFMAVSDARFSHLVCDYRTKRMGEVFQGSAVMSVARLVLVATTATTFDHFVQTLDRLVPTFRDMLRSETRIVVWSKMSKHYSVGVAAQCRDTITFWVLPVGKLNSVLRTHPETAVAVCITDEFTVDTPRERSRTSHSFVINQGITQATPQALSQATTGARSWLKELMGGALIAPSRIDHLLRQRSFSAAQLAVEQLCRLDLMTLTAFRDRVRDDLAALVPPSLHVHFAKSRRTTMASFLEQSQTDFVPANFANVLVAHLQPFRPTLESVQRLRDHLAQHVGSVEILAECILSVESTVYPPPDVNLLTRLSNRLLEYQEGCAVCFEQNDDTANVRIFGCCGCCTCTACFSRVSRCPFCRADVPTRVTRADAMMVEEEEEEEPHTPTVVPDTLEEGATFAESLSRHVDESNTQLVNLVSTLKIMTHFAYRRILLIAEMPIHYTNGDYFIERHMGHIASQTGIRLIRVDHRLSGKGTEFARIKKLFDSDDPVPMALVCSGHKTGFLVGTDLAHADSIVTVGHIPDSILTQSLGRVFRPRASRDNTKPVVMVKVST